MSDKGIIFSAPMVRALLSGTKTQTRRLLKLPTTAPSGGPIYEHPKMGGWEATTHGGGGCFTIGKNGERIPAPKLVGIWHQTCGICIVVPQQPGDRIYVREAHNLDWGDQVLYRAGSGSAVDAGYSKEPKWRPSIHMPRWASRLTLLVTDVRVQRLQDISEADAKAEGVEMVAGRNYRDGFAILWNSLHTKPGTTWSDNPWVVAVTFDVEHRNIDQLGES